MKPLHEIWNTADRELCLELCTKARVHERAANTSWKRIDDKDRERLEKAYGGEHKEGNK